MRRKILDHLENTLRIITITCIKDTDIDEKFAYFFN